MVTVMETAMATATTAAALKAIVSTTTMMSI